MVRPLTPLTAGAPHVPLRDAEGDGPAGRRAGTWWMRALRGRAGTVVWTAVFVVGIPVAAASIWAFDYAAVAVFGGFGALLRLVLGFFVEHLYADD